MNTPAHLALSLAVLGRKSRRGDWWWIGAGALLPDLFLFADWGLRGTSSGLRDLNALLADVANSLPVWGAVLALALLTSRRRVALLAASALLHIALDLPLHAGDAHAHFWPLTDWRLISPVSFWDHEHYGRLFGALEGALFAICIVVIWRRLDTGWQRMAGMGFAAIYGLAFVHFVGHAFADAHWAIW